jgi:hypothetical protein
MAFIDITDTEVLPDKVAKASTMQHINDDLDYLYAEKLKLEALLWALGE